MNREKDGEIDGWRCNHWFVNKWVLSVPRKDKKTQNHKCETDVNPDHHPIGQGTELN